MKAKLEWAGDLQLVGNAGGRLLQLDGNRYTASSPMEALMLSLGGCMAIDLVSILDNKQARLKTMRVRVEGTRTETNPRRFTRIKLHFELGGDNFGTEEVDHAITLSREKLCSVYHSLRSDIEVIVTFEIL